MYPVYTFVVVFLLVHTTHQQTIGPERKQEFCNALQTNLVLEEAMPLVRRHLEAATHSSRLLMDGVNARLTALQSDLDTTDRAYGDIKNIKVSLEAVQAELETTQRRNGDMEVSLEAVQAELETTKQRNNDMKVSFEAVQAELETSKRRNGDMEVSLEAVQAELENTKRRNGDMEVSLEAVQAELETSKRRNGDMEVSLEAVQAELETTKREIQELKAFKTASTTPAMATTTTNKSLECYYGWISSPEKCYFVSPYSKGASWYSFQDRCKDLGARPVEIKTDDEARIIMNSLPDYIGNNDFIYTGRRRNDNNIWVFLNNDEEVDTSVRTWSYRYHAGGNRRCGCTTKTGNFKMLNCYCTGLILPYICEIMR
ncbi:streptococcal surface protein A-like [Argopecten irradians]|uniref:streptococcal surface protein A-like n=1 Tax=Argopecten irradians TaxID=31199 RepID=UPI0037117F3F